MKKIPIIVEKTEIGYSAYTEEFPIYTVGDNLDELKSNIHESINLYFEEELS